ncbi:hypothetical protein GGR56DRAFT_427312 [Xylariaceae sp. FL0804]|nr:hypothetical protein GGR56DRAFT_427312 [Xylariaceae sp. FL0804]
MAGAAANPGATELSPLDQLMPRGYIRQILCFPAAGPRAVEVLRAGLAGTVRDVPFLLSTVVAAAAATTTIAASAATPLQLSAPCQTVDDIFSARDFLSDSKDSKDENENEDDTAEPAPDYAALRAAGFPPGALAFATTTEDDVVLTVAPPSSPSSTSSPSRSAAPPVFRARATRVRHHGDDYDCDRDVGGLLLCVAVHHCTTDISGLGSLLAVWAAHCRYVTGSEGSLPAAAAAGFDAGWLDRRPLFCSSVDDDGDDNDGGSSAAEQPGGGQEVEVPAGGAALPHKAKEGPPLPPPLPELLHTPDAPARAGEDDEGGDDYVTGIYFFPQAGLARLKAGVNAYLASSSSSSSTSSSSSSNPTSESSSASANSAWVSTSDVLTALLWRAVLAAEQHPPLPPPPQRDHVDLPVPATATATATVVFPVNFRTRTDPPLVPAGYLGAAFVVAGATAELDLDPGLPPSPSSSSSSSDNNGSPPPISPASLLARAALAVREAVSRVDGRFVRALLAQATAGAEGGRRRLALGPRRGRDTVVVVSWADEGVHGLDWGGAVATGGRGCEAVRFPWRGRPRRRRHPIVLPRLLPRRYGDGDGDDGGKGSGGGLEVLLCLERAAMERFAACGLVRTYAVPRCVE